MKSLSLKISLVIISYIILFALIVLSYVSIVPNNNMIVLENRFPLVKKLKIKLGLKVTQFTKF